jgi:2-oxoglutarate dehydrogenase E2 component (dihydrolipoamide succinyltransferase)
MKHDILAPMVGESITEVSILKWAKQNGAQVKSGDSLLEIESDKATVEIVAEQSGVLTILKNDGEKVDVKSVIGSIDDAATAAAGAAPAKAPPPAAGAGAPPPPPNAQQSSAPPPPPNTQPAASPPPPPLAPPQNNSAPVNTDGLSPAVRKAVVENNVNPAQVSGTGKDGRVTKGDVMSFIASGAARLVQTQLPTHKDKPGDRRQAMPMIRKRIAERLVFAQHTAAILTTFNEVDMKPVQDVRTQHKDAFEKKYGTKLSFMSFFTRACTLALKQLPAVNASIEGTDFVFHDYADIGVAVGTERGLVVPVVRGADKMTFAEIEKGIGELALKARNGKLSIADMSGGTFTISNGGTYGSLLSTPILNPPQSAILGMHKIMDRPMAINGKVEIRPMMYLALSYDHRIIDGKVAVTFLVTLKDLLENPTKLGLDFA